MSQRVNPTTLAFNDELGKFQPFLSPSLFPQPPQPNAAELGLAFINSTLCQQQTWETG